MVADAMAIAVLVVNNNNGGGGDDRGNDRNCGDCKENS